MGAQCNDTNAQLCQPPQEWGPPRYKYYGSVKHNDLAAIRLKVIYHPLYGMNNFVRNKSKLPQDGTQVFPYMA